MSSAVRGYFVTKILSCHAHFLPTKYRKEWILNEVTGNTKTCTDIAEEVLKEYLNTEMIEKRMEKETFRKK